MSIAAMTAPHPTHQTIATPPQQEPQPAARSSTLWVLVVFLLPFAALAAHHWAWDPPSGSGDYAQYLSHARALVEGRSYTDIGYIYHPRAPMVGPRAYPPGLPLTLAPIVAFAGVSSPLNRVLMLATLLAFAYLAYRRLAMDIAPWQAAIAAGITSLAIEAHFGTLVPLSDVGLCALMWATVLAVDGARSWTWRRVALVTALGFAAMAYRVAGVALVPALALYALLTWPRHQGRALYPVLVWGGAGVAALTSTALELPFADFLMPQLPELAERMRHVVSTYVLGALGAELYPLPSNQPNDVYHVLASVFLAAGAVALLWRLRRTMLTAMTVMYTAVLLASPAINDRYLWPVLPVLAAGFVLGVTALWRLLASRLGRPTRGPVLTAATFALISIGALAHELRVPRLPSDARDPQRQALFAWLREARQRGRIRVMYANPRVLTLETRVTAMPPLFAKPATHLAAMYDRDITHLILPTATPTECRARLAYELPTVFPQVFALEYQNGGFRVYRVMQTGSPIPPIDNYQPSWGGDRCNPNRNDSDRERER